MRIATFGRSVAVDGNVMVAGARDPGNGEAPNMVFVFERHQGGPDAWRQVAKLVDEDGAVADHFGGAVAIAGDTVVIGAEWDDDLFETSGSVHVFRPGGGGVGSWARIVKLSCPPIYVAVGTFFGTAVTVSDDTAIIGAPGHNDNGVSAGAAYVFERDHDGPGVWGLLTKLTASDGDEADHFGGSVAISGGSAVVGAWQDDEGGSASGSAYGFRRPPGSSGAWDQIAKLIPADGMPGDQFGAAAAMDGITIVVGTPSDDILGLSSGSALVFTDGDRVFDDGFETGDTSRWSTTAP